MDDRDPILNDNDLDRLWADLADELSPAERAELELALASRPELLTARARVAETQRLLSTLDEPGPAPDIASPVVARLLAREAPAPVRPWLWLAPVIQIGLAVAAVAWALPGLMRTLGQFDGLMTVPTAADTLANAQVVWTGWMGSLGDLSRGLMETGLDPASGGLWLGVCVAGAVLAWLAGNSVLLATQLPRRR